MNRTRGFEKIYVSTRNIYIVEKIKLQSDATLGCSDKRIKNSKFVAKTKFLYKGKAEKWEKIKLENVKFSILCPPFQPYNFFIIILIFFESKNHKYVFLIFY